jgi:hypothetical protein
MAGKESILRVHLVPRFGDLSLDQITTERVQGLKGELSGKAAKTVNNILTVLNTLLRVAVDWRVIAGLPCTIRLVKAVRPMMIFHSRVRRV